MKAKTFKRLKTLLAATAALTLSCAFAIAMPKIYKGVVFADENITTIETVEGFEMGFGADVREDGEEGGIRYTTKVSENAYAEIKEKGETVTFYTLLARADKVGFNDLTIEKANDETLGDYVIKTKASQQPDGESIKEYKITYLTGNTLNYSKKLVARGVAEIIDQDNKATYIYATENDNERSMSGLAVSAIADDDNTSDSGLKKYFTSQSATSETFVEKESDATTLALEKPTMTDDESVKAAFVNGEKIAVSTENGITLNDVSKVKSEKYGGDINVTLYTDKNNVYNVTVKTVSKVIKTEAEFLKLYDYLDITNDTTNYILTMDGYVVLGANLDFSNYSDYKEYPISSAKTTRQGFGWESYLTNIITSGNINSYIETVWLGGNVDNSIVRTNGIDSNNKTIIVMSDLGKTVANSNGFIGTFDGQGHTIKGLRIAHGGLFPTVGKTGVIKNVAFADTTLAVAACTFGSLFAGTLDNVLVDVTATQSGSYQNCGISKVLVGTVKNSVLYMLNTENLTENDKNGGIVAHQALSVSGITRDVWTGFYVFADASKNYFYYNVDNTQFDGSTGGSKIFFSDVKSFTSYEKKNTNGYDSDIWDFDSHVIPVFKTYNGTNISAKTATAE